jgi:hypothetical protein
VPRHMHAHSGGAYECAVQVSANTDDHHTFVHTVASLVCVQHTRARISRLPTRCVHRVSVRRHGRRPSYNACARGKHARVHIRMNVLQSQFMIAPLHMLYAKVAALTRTTMDACVPAKKWWRMKYGIHKCNHAAQLPNFQYNRHSDRPWNAT